MNIYCSWQLGDFTNFTDIDRQTELTDLDGSLTGLLSSTPAGLEPTISVNNDPVSDPTSVAYDADASPNFFGAPVITPECATAAPSDPSTPAASKPTATVNTSPYEYVTTAIFPSCLGTGTCANWGRACSNQSCYGVPLYRQYMTDAEYADWQQKPTKRPTIRMMGQDTGQRSNLTMSHGSYYIDTTVPNSIQNPTGNGNPNVFQANSSYYVYVLYAKPSLLQTYSFYIGTGLSNTEAESTITTGIVNPFAGTTPAFTPGTGPESSTDWITSKSYDTKTGVISVTLDLTKQTGVFDLERPKSCQPTTYCSLHSDGSCGCKAGSNCKEDSVCAWGPKEIDCPVAGCFGFSVNLPGSFQTATGTPISPPDPIRFSASGDSYFAQGNVKFESAPLSVSGAQCHYDSLGIIPRPHKRIGNSPLP